MPSAGIASGVGSCPWAQGSASASARPAPTLQVQMATGHSGYPSLGQQPVQGCGVAAKGPEPGTACARDMECCGGPLEVSRCLAARLSLHA